MRSAAAHRLLRVAGNSRALKLPQRVSVYEVGPRDGLQNERRIIDTQTKIAFVDMLSATGVSSVEAASFVSPKWMPSLADGANVLRGITAASGVDYPVLVPNMRGLERAFEAGALTVAVMTTPSESFSLRNMNNSVEGSTAVAEKLAAAATAAGLRCRAYVSCALGCPFEGKVAPQVVAELTARLIGADCYEVALSDTHGKGTPGDMTALLGAVFEFGSPAESLAVHCHDTYGQALANVLVALQHGITTVDSSVAGLGGCPLAGGTGNLATEDLVWMLDGMGVESGVDFDQVVAAGDFITKALLRTNSSRAAVARLRDASKPALDTPPLNDQLHIGNVAERAQKPPASTQHGCGVSATSAAWRFEQPVMPRPRAF